MFAVAVALAMVCALSVRAITASAQTPDPLIAPGEGAAGSRFQVVGQAGWTPGETVTISVAFSDQAPGPAFSGDFYHERQVPVLRDGTWSFPIVVNSDLFPFPLWRPGYIVVRAQSGTHAAINAFAYTVEGRSPAGLPPLAELGSGPGARPGVLPLSLALLSLATGALVLLSATLRVRTD